MITKLRLENAMLNEKKNGPATHLRNLAAPGGAETIPINADKHLHMPDRDGEDVMDELINNAEDYVEVKRKKKGSVGNLLKSSSRNLTKSPDKGPTM